MTLNLSEQMSNVGASGMHNGQVSGFCNPIGDKQKSPKACINCPSRQNHRDIMFVQFISNFRLLENEFGWVEVHMFHGKFNYYWWQNMGMAGSKLGIPIVLW